MSFATALFHRTRRPEADVSSGWHDEPRTGMDGYHVFDAPGSDVPGAPTRQPGVMPGHGYEPQRTPFGAAGVPGAGVERAVTDLDLTANQHPDGFAFAAENGRGTHEVPRMPGQRPAGAGLPGSDAGSTKTGTAVPRLP